ncbi:SpoIVB peptidase [Thermoclostridium stercorarium subsp. stercorarium DSM 8532]|uniref:SpoIVB peptidase n=1 Tax=Thermoclostridium stercorarium (strain ATCC 35414 / DSM 8532 / NCIMB 11754) TaxID=1121335 RepID=L7VQQ3_THES1|nr:SpoIVB peptidase [Thermoclostridium stercorarium]AGC69009.1 SpoIVB peptidase [Thermoclostridium stercorarium subsp. stercorarium DSM 8532]AGI39988.1 sporulation protein 4B [Thermoclostridium stercorarium subsp. stercorarium DSM 8532]
MIFKREKSFFRFCFPVFVVIVSLYFSVIAFTPSQMTVLAGEEYRVEFFSPFRLQLAAETGGIHVQKLDAGDRTSFFSMPYTLKGTQYGQNRIQLSLFGLVPVKDITVNVIPARELIVCGNTVGIRLYIKGILVVGISGVLTSEGKEVLPVKDTGLEPGDFIVAVNNKEVEKISDLSKIIEESGGKEITLKFLHDNRLTEAKVTPVQSAEDGKYRIGIWVRDSTAGIGTLTYIEEETGKFGALGHGITDIDTGIMMPVKTGELLKSSVYGIRKGLQGSPGELQGDFLKSPEVIGEIYWNTAFGVFGKINKDYMEEMKGRKYPVGTRSMVKEGPATILSNIHGEEVEEFSVEIQKIARKNLSGPKSMIIKITDPRLLSETGGIIQGMSGSPIIQDGRIIGAVTHVLVSDPTKGYGIFIETMLGMY